MGTVMAGLLVLLLLGAGYQFVGSARDAVRRPPPGRLVDIGAGRRLHLHCAGEGRTPSVILDAGIAASSLSWSRVAPGVAGFARVCTYDRAGLAWSDSGPQPTSARRFARDLHALVVAASVPPPYVLVGHSFGSFVVRAFTDEHQDAVAGLVLVDPIFPSEWLGMTPAQRRRLSGGVFLSRVGALLAAVGFVRACLALLVAGSTGVPKRVSRLFGPEAATVLRRLVGEVQKLPQDLWPTVASHWSQPKCFLSMAGHLAGLRRSAEEVAAMGGLGDIPLVVITAASQSEPVRHEHARIAGLSAQGRHVLASAGGHWVHLDEPDLVVRSIREVVDSARVNTSTSTPTGTAAGHRPRESARTSASPGSCRADRNWSS
jgi:pimeloyl-ACP methyl ester carboxylesterase